MKMRTRQAMSTIMAAVGSVSGVASGAWGQEVEETGSTEVIVVRGDPVGLLERRPSETVFGLGMSLMDTPRSATLVTDTTLERYGIEEVDDLISISPGTFTASFYGVRGAVNIRGTLAEAYFRGFKRIENRGTYPTPLGATSQVDVVRGPPTPVYGPGKVGGFINIVPQTARASGPNFVDAPTGRVELTAGSYGKFNAAGALALPVSLGGTSEGGVFGYLEYEDSESFYRGVEPEHLLAQLSAEFDLTDTLHLSLGGMFYDAEGYVQTPGWNRITQQLIDEQLYFTGRDTTVVDLDGNGRFTPDEAGGGFVTGYFGFPPTVSDRYTLDEGIGLAPLDPRTVFISDRDFSDTATNTFYAELSKEIGDSSLHLELFYDDLENQRFVSYGFPADYDSAAWEARVHYDFGFELFDGAVSTTNTVGAGYRSQEAVKMESFNSGFIVLDRRDLTVGATPNDIFDDPFSDEPGGIGAGWDIVVDSDWSDTGLFAVSDIALGERVNLLLGGRYDFYEAQSIDTGAICFCPGNILFDTDEEEWSYSASLSVDAPFGLMPYYTYAETAALEIGQAGDLAPALLANGQWISDSLLKEGGVKFEFLDGSLLGSVAGYEQSRTRLTQTNSVVATTARGVEFEARWLATDHLSFTVAANTQKTTVEGPDASFSYVPGRVVGLPLEDALGGSFAVFNFAQSPVGQPGDYEQKSIPQTVASVFGSYITDTYDWGELGVTAGLIHVSETSGKLANPVVYPDYELVNLSGFWSLGDFEVAVNIDNVFDELYFQPVADVYADMAVLPGRGREYRVILKKTF